MQLPDNSIVVGKVTSVGGTRRARRAPAVRRAVPRPAAASSTSGSSATAATVALNNPALGNSIAGSSVNVIVTTNSVNDVLAVPLGALLATSSGQFIVQVPNANGTAVATSASTRPIYDDTRGIVAVPGANLSPGERVVVAAS